MNYFTSLYLMRIRSRGFSMRMQASISDHSKDGSPCLKKDECCLITRVLILTLKSFSKLCRVAPGVPPGNATLCIRTIIKQVFFRCIMLLFYHITAHGGFNVILVIMKDTGGLSLLLSAGKGSFS